MSDTPTPITDRNRQRPEAMVDDGEILFAVGADVAEGLERELSAATARADALLLALECARHEMICAAASGQVRLENIDKVLNEARKGATVPQWMATRKETNG